MWRVHKGSDTAGASRVTHESDSVRISSKTGQYLEREIIYIRKANYLVQEHEGESLIPEAVISRHFPVSRCEEAYKWIKSS